MAPVRLTGQTAGQRSISDLHTLMTYIVWSVHVRSLSYKRFVH